MVKAKSINLNIKLELKKKNWRSIGRCGGGEKNLEKGTVICSG